MKRIGLLLKTGNPDAVKLGSEISAWAMARGSKVYAALPATVQNCEAVPAEKLKDLIDLLVVLGGDGTMLYAARLIGGKKTPILGVNMGGLGFLTAITTRELLPLLERVGENGHEVEERMMLCVEHSRREEVIARHTVLNDAVIKGRSARLLRMEMRINKEYVTTYRADGLIVASPTGSTAYSLSAAGPILFPTIHSIIVSPICPFNLTNRPVVIPDWMSVDVTLAPGQSDTLLILDGQIDVPIVSGDAISVRRAVESVYLVKYEGKSYFDILRERLMWEVKVEKRPD